MPKAKLTSSQPTVDPTRTNVSIKNHLADVKAQKAQGQALKTSSKLVRRLLGEKDTKAYAMPQASSLPVDDFQMAVRLLERSIELRNDIAQLEKEFKEVKDQIIVIATEHDVPGFRHGKTAVIVGSQARTSLSKEKLLELGVAPEVIAEAMVEGAEFYTVKFSEIPG